MHLAVEKLIELFLCFRAKTLGSLCAKFVSFSFDIMLFNKFINDRLGNMS